MNRLILAACLLTLTCLLGCSNKNNVVGGTNTAAAAKPTATQGLTDQPDGVIQRKGR